MKVTITHKAREIPPGRSMAEAEPHHEIVQASAHMLACAIAARYPRAVLIRLSLDIKIDEMLDTEGDE